MLFHNSPQLLDFKKIKLDHGLVSYKSMAIQTLVYVSVTLTNLYHVFTYIFCSFLIETDTCDRRNISIKFPCVCVCHSSGNLFILRVKISQ